MKLQREFGYGEKRNLNLLENYAIRSRLRRVRHCVMSKIQSAKNMPVSILELGCGFNGSNLLALKKEFPTCDITGVDISINNEVFDGINFVKADPDSWTPDKHYDVIFSLAVVEHLTNIEQHFRLMARCANDHSAIIITSPTPQAHIILSTLARIGMIDREEIEDHKLYFTKNGLFQCAIKAGLSIIEYKTFLMLLNQVAVLKKA